MVNDIHFDYLSLTLHPKGDNPIGAMVVGGMVVSYVKEDFVNTRGLRGYDHALRFLTSGVLVLHGGYTQRDTIHVVIPGQACRIFGLSGLRSFYNRLSTFGDVVFTRYDVACDRSGLDFQREIASVCACVISPYVRTVSYHATADIRVMFAKMDLQAVAESLLSRTVYIGSRQSEKMLRVYGKVDADNEPYTRVELEIKGDTADLHMQAFFADSALTVSALAVKAFDKFFDVEMFLGVRLDDMSIVVESTQRQRVKRSLVYYLAQHGALLDCIQYYGQENFINMLKERKQAKQMQLVARGIKRKTPVGDTGVTMFKFEDFRPEWDFREDKQDVFL